MKINSPHTRATLIRIVLQFVVICVFTKINFIVEAKCYTWSKKFERPNFWIILKLLFPEKFSHFSILNSKIYLSRVGILNESCWSLQELLLCWQLRTQIFNPWQKIAIVWPPTFLTTKLIQYVFGAF